MFSGKKEDPNDDERQEDPVIFPPPPQLLRTRNVEGERIDREELEANQPALPDFPNLNARTADSGKYKKRPEESMCVYSGETVPCPEEMIRKAAKRREAYLKKKAADARSGRKKSPRKSPKKSPRKYRKSPKKSPRKYKKSPKKSPKRSRRR